MAVSGHGLSPRTDTTRFHWGDRGFPAHAGTRGSPFQMPTRLADGLGPESDLADGSPPAFAPSAILRGFGSPALTCRKASQLRLLTSGKYLRRARCQIVSPQVAGHEGNIIAMVPAHPCPHPICPLRPIRLLAAGEAVLT